MKLRDRLARETEMYVITSIALPLALRRKVDVLASARNMKRQELIRLALEHELAGAAETGEITATVDRLFGPQQPRA